MPRNAFATQKINEKRESQKSKKTYMISKFYMQMDETSPD